MHWLRAKPVNGTHPELYPLEFDKLKADLNVEGSAKRAALMGQPSPQRTTLDACEVRIVEVVEEHRTEVINWANRVLCNLRGQMAKLDVTGAVNRARGYADEFKREANELLSAHDQEIRQRHERAQSLKDELRLFKADHGLQRVAKMPDSGLGPAVWRWLLVLFMIGAEGFANAGFFATSLEGGWIQGFGFAVLLAGFNVLVALALGRFGITQLHHRSAFRRLLGGGAWLLWFSVALAVALGTAHLRDVYAAGVAEGAAVMAKERLVTAPFSFSEIYSYLLLGLSFAFAVAALIKGYRWGDPYPGYESITLRAEAASGDYEHGVSELRQLLEDIKDRFEMSLDKEVETARTCLHLYRTQIHQKENLQHRMQALLDKDSFVLASLIEFFRAENTLHRKDLPRPAYFDTPVALRQLPIPMFDTSSDSQFLAKQDALFRQLVNVVEPIRRDIQSAFVACYDQLTPIRDHVKAA